MVANGVSPRGVRKRLKLPGLHHSPSLGYSLDADETAPLPALTVGDRRHSHAVPPTGTALVTHR